jgi:hypothetical protein
MTDSGTVPHFTCPRIAWRFVVMNVWFLVGGGLPSVHAATFSVDHTGDDTVQMCDDATPNDCSLRGAILTSNGQGRAPP